MSNMQISTNKQQKKDKMKPFLITGGIWFWFFQDSDCCCFVKIFISSWQKKNIDIINTHKLSSCFHSLSLSLSLSLAFQDHQSRVLCTEWMNVTMIILIMIMQATTTTKTTTKSTTTTTTTITHSLKCYFSGVIEKRRERKVK